MGEKQEKQANAINATWDYLKDSLLQLLNSTLWTDHHFRLVLYHKRCSIVQQKKSSFFSMLMVVSVYRMFLQEYCKAVCSTKYKLNDCSDWCRNQAQPDLHWPAWFKFEIISGQKLFVLASSHDKGINRFDKCKNINSNIYTDNNWCLGRYCGIPIHWHLILV